MKGLYAKNYKVLMKGIQEIDGRIPMISITRINIIKRLYWSPVLWTIRLLPATPASNMSAGPD